MLYANYKRESSSFSRFLFDLFFGFAGIEGSGTANMYHYQYQHQQN